MSNRNSWLDFLKLLSIISVIVIHVGPLYTIPSLKVEAVLINNLMRFSVPVFFICSGYFLSSSKNSYDIQNSKLVNNLRRMIKVYVIWNIIYFFLITNNSHHGFFYYIFFGTSAHLWFLSAFIQCILMKICLDFIGRLLKINENYVLLVSFIFFILTVYGNRYFLENQSECIKTGLTVFLFFFYGVYVRSNHNLSFGLSITLVLFGFCLQFCEVIISWYFLNLSPTIDFNLGTFLFSAGVFNFFLNIRLKPLFLSYFGRFTLGIYLIHYYVIYVLSRLSIGNSVSWQLSEVVFVFFISYLISFLLSNSNRLCFILGEKSE